MTAYDYRARSRRKRATRPRTLSLYNRPKASFAEWQRSFLAGLAPAAKPTWRPKPREDCRRVERPCPYVACRHHLYLDVLGTGSIKLNFPDLEPDEMPADGSCSLDVAERGGLKIESVAELMNLTRERARQLMLDVGRLRSRFE